MSNLYYSVLRSYHFIVRFLYYGKIGATKTYDFDSSGIDTLIHAHISRVNDFMHDPKQTHLVWNSDPQNRRMRLLREFTELSKRKDEDKCGYYFSQIFEKYGDDILERINDPDYRKESGIAMKKDAMIKKDMEDRYWYLLRYVVPSFWD